MTTQSTYVAHMKEPLGKRFDALWQELGWLNVKWAQYVELYATKESRIDLLNKTAPLFFRIVQDTLLEDVLLHIARLTERSSFKGQRRIGVHVVSRVAPQQPPRYRTDARREGRAVRHRSAGWLCQNVGGFTGMFIGATTLAILWTVLQAWLGTKEHPGSTTTAHLPVRP